MTRVDSSRDTVWLLTVEARRNSHLHIDSLREFMVIKLANVVGVV